MKKISCLFVLLISFGAFAQSDSESKAKNILFIAVDDLKPMLNVYGETYMHTPNIDRLAEMGVMFTNAHVQQAVCGPSRASIMTAMYPDNTKVWDLHTDFRESAPDLISMPEYLISQGYETSGTGKIYHQGSMSDGHDGNSWSVPHTSPSKELNTFVAPGISYRSKENREIYEALAKEAKAKGITRANKIKNYLIKKHRPATEAAEVADAVYLTGQYTNIALGKIDAFEKGDKPWFIGVGFQKPHLPFVAPKKYWDIYKREEIQLEEFQELSEGTPKIAYHSFGELRAYTDIDNNLSVGDVMPAEKQRELIHGYMACISYVDAQIGILLNDLEQRGILEETIIVLWGDHGYHLGDHTLWNKHSNFEQATRIPFLFAGPGVATNKKISEPAEVLDVFPTLFDLAGIEIPDVDGKSLVPVIDNDANTSRDLKLAASQFRRHKSKMGYSIRTDRYRYTEWFVDDFRSYSEYGSEKVLARELYDYEKDPKETKNLVDVEAYEKVAAEMQVLLVDHLKSIPKR